MYTAELLRQAQATAAAATAATAAPASAPQLSPLQAATVNGHSSSAPLLTAPLGTARQAFAAQRSISTAAAAAAAAAVPAAAAQTPQTVAALLSAMEDTPWLQRGATAAGSGRNVRSSNGRSNGFTGATTAGSKHKHGGKSGYVGPESRLVDSGSLATAAAAVKVEAAERRAAAAEAQVQFAELQHITAPCCCSGRLELH
jgi:hypothetical protein